MKKRTSHAASVGVIGGDDGPTAIFTVSSKEMEKRRSEQEAFLNRRKSWPSLVPKVLMRPFGICALYMARSLVICPGDSAGV